MAENLGASFSIDVTALKAGLAQANKLIRESESEFKAAAAGMGDWSKSQEGLEKRIKSLNDIAGVQQKKVDALKSEYDRLIKDGLDPSSTKAIELRTQINKETEALNKSKTEIDKNQKALDNFGKESDDASKDVKKLSDETDKGTGSFTVMKGALADLVSAGIKAAITGFKDLAKYAVEAFQAVDEGRDNVVKATGATGAAAKELEQNYKNVAKSIKGDFGDIGTVLGEVNTRFGFTGDKLEEATKQFIKFGDITGEDAKSAVIDVAKALKSAGASSDDYGKLLDQLAKAAQATGISTSDLASGITKNAPAMRALGFDTTETIAILGQFEKSGMNTETAIGGMQKAIQNWTKDGKNAKTEFSKVIEQIKKAPNDTKGAQIAIENFGKKSGTELAEAIRTGRFEYKDFLELIENSAGTVDSTYKETQDGFDQLSVVIQGVKTDMSDFVSEIMDNYGPQIESFIKKVTDGTKNIINWCIEHLPQIEAALAGIVTGFLAFKAVSIVMSAITVFKNLYTTLQLVKTGQLALNASMLANPIGIVVAAIAGLVAAFVVLWNKCKGFREFWKTLWETIKNAAKVAWDAIVGFFKGAWDKIKAAWGGVASFFSGIWDGIKNAFSAVGSWFSEKFSAAWTGIKNVFSAVGSFFSGIWDTITSPFKAAANWFSKKFEAVVKAIKKPFEAIGEFFSDIWDSIKSPFESAGSKLRAEIEMKTGKKVELATGGVVRRATNAIIGEDGAEAVVPLEHNTGWLDSLADRLAARTGGGVVVNQTNNYSQSHSRYEIYKSQQATAKAVKLAMAR